MGTGRSSPELNNIRIDVRSKEKSDVREAVIE